MRIWMALALAAAVAALTLLAFRLPAHAGGELACVWGRTVGLDAGHGGSDPGAVRGRYREAPLVLALTLRLRDLVASAGMRPVMTREDDDDAGGRQGRIGLLNGARVDAALSLHANAFPQGRWYGAQVFYNPKRYPQSRLLAEAVQRQLGALTDTQGRQVSGDIDHFILNHVDAPAVTVEVGFLSNAREAELLADPTYQSRLAWAVFRGMLDYFSRARCPS